LKENDSIENIMKKMDIHEIFPCPSNRKSMSFMHKLLPEISNLGIKLMCDDDPREVN